jgi:Type VI secretion system/phage-baseplate injector OB domain
MAQPFYGKYPAVVIDNLDPEQRGRLRVRIPDVAPDYEAWAVPSWPAGQAPEEHHVPDVGADVWVEFERGDAEYPIWDGVQ